MSAGCMLRALVALCSIAGAVAAQDAPLAVIAPDGPLLLGDRFELIVTGGLDTSARVTLDALPEGLQPGEPRFEQVLDGLALHLPLRAVREGDLRVDGLAIVDAGGERAVPPVDITVMLDLPPGRTPRVADPLGPVHVPMPPADLLPFLVGLPLTLLLLGLFAAMAGRRIAPPPPVRRPPELIAADAFAQLRTHLPRTRDEVPAFVTSVSGVLRTYIEDVFRVRAPESTTEEFLYEVAARHDSLAEHRESLGGFLTSCDLVKFARHRPEPAIAEPLLLTAEDFVEATHG